MVLYDSDSSTGEKDEKLVTKLNAPVHIGKMVEQSGMFVNFMLYHYLCIFCFIFLQKYSICFQLHEKILD